MPPARAAYLAALEIATELGMRPLIAQCHLGLGSLSAAPTQEPHAHLEAAAAMFREMGMDFWLKKAEQQAGQLG